MLLFGWIILVTCLFDSLTTLSLVNVGALFPDKFRTDSARRRATGWSTPLSMIALPIATIVAPILLAIGGGLQDPSAYVLMIWVCIGIIAPVSILFLPGMVENKEMIDRYYVAKEKPQGFIPTLKSTLKQKSFAAYLVLFFGFQIVTGSLTASIPYAVNFVLQGSELDIILLFAAFLIGAIVSVPIWILISKRVQNNKKMAVIGGICLTFGTLLTAFYIGIIDSMIYQAILGFTMGNFWALTAVWFADVLDERVVLTRSDVRGAVVGVQSFFSRLSRAVQIGIFAAVHILTGFVEGAPTQSPLAQLGIRLHMSIIPSIFLAICMIIYWKFYPLTNDKIMENKVKLKELGF